MSQAPRSNGMRSYFVAVLVALAIFGCGTTSSPTLPPLGHWPRAEDGVVRFTYQFPGHPTKLEAPLGVLQPDPEANPLSEAARLQVRLSFRRWEIAAASRGIRLEAVEVPPDTGGAQVDIVSRPLDGRFLGYAEIWHIDKASKTFGRIVVQLDPAHESEWRVAIPHELGHVLGLGHLGDTRSLMHASKPNADITDADLDALAEIYLPSAQPL